MEKDKILIVEDDKDLRFVLERLLIRNNFEIKTTVNGREALEALKTFQPKVILVDWGMPVMDGLELCNIIKQNENYKHIYFVILTGRNSLTDKVKGLDIGADDFLIKPVENQELLARIRSGIRIYNLQNELRKIEHNKALIEMACTIGHELNNPLSGLIMSLKNIENDITTQNLIQYNDDLSVINESIARIKTLINNLINLKNPTVIDYTSENKMLKL